MGAGGKEESPLESPPSSPLLKPVSPPLWLGVGVVHLVHLAPVLILMHSGVVHAVAAIHLAATHLHLIPHLTVHHLLVSHLVHLVLVHAVAAGHLTLRQRICASVWIAVISSAVPVAVAVPVDLLLPHLLYALPRQALRHRVSTRIWVAV